MDVITELKQDYAALAELLANTIGSDYGDALSGYIAACWMKIWSGNKLYAPEYAKAIGCVLGREPSMEQCLTALSCCGDESRKLDVPALFHQLVACDAAQKTGAVSDFLAQLNHILVAGASCNGDFTIEEANAVTAILKSLVACAKKAKLPVKDVPHISDPIYINLRIQHHFLEIMVTENFRQQPGVEFPGFQNINRIITQVQGTQLCV